MNDRELKDQLKDLNQLVQKTVMQNWGFSPRMRAHVHELVNAGKTAGDEKICANTGRASGACKWPFIIKGCSRGILETFKKVKPAYALVTAVAMCFGVFAFHLLPLEPLNVKTVQEQQVDVDGIWPPEMVKVVEVNDRGIGSAGYITMIWTAGPGEKGWDLIYSYPLEKDYRPLPIKTISLPDQKNNLVLISTQEKQANFLSYQVLGHDGQKVLTYLERTFIPQGDTKTGPGYVIETGNDGYRLFRWNGNGFVEDAAYEPGD